MNNIKSLGKLRKRVLQFAVAVILVVLTGAALAATAPENYRFYCAQCHGEKGRGDGPNAIESMPVSPRDHTNSKDMSKLTDEDIMNAIADGGVSVSKSSLMPPFGKTLSDKEIRDLSGYLRKLCNCRAK